MKCAYCDIILKIFKNYTIEFQVKSVDDLKKICNALPKELIKDCDEMVGIFGPEILEKFDNEDMDTICFEHKICETNKCKLDINYRTWDQEKHLFNKPSDEIASENILDQLVLSL